MTEYELEDLLTGTSVAAVDSFGMYVTILVAYLIAAHLAGKQLSSLQIVTVSVLFVVASSITLWATYAYMSRSIPLADQLELINPHRTYGAQPLVRDIMAMVQSLGIIACLSFMWSISALDLNDGNWHRGGMQP